jgi:hypothetical protein
VITPDLINGAFEAFGGFMLILSILRLHRDKTVRGVSPIATTFFSAWGLWNLYYYPHLDQWLSFWGGAFLVTANIVWLCQMGYYIRKERKHGRK